VPVTTDGVVWEADRDIRFQNPPGQNLCEAFRGTIKPPNWIRGPCELDPIHPENNGFQNVDFIVWMRTAALPSFRKLYRILDRNIASSYSNGLPAGRYRLTIENSKLFDFLRNLINYVDYPVNVFNGKKSFIISTTTWSGGHNNFLGIAYIFVGSACVIFGIVFSFIHIKFGHS
jgi:hypothetical protein